MIGLAYPLEQPLPRLRRVALTEEDPLYRANSRLVVCESFRGEGLSWSENWKSFRGREPGGVPVSALILAGDASSEGLRGERLGPRQG